MLGMEVKTRFRKIFWDFLRKIPSTSPHGWEILQPSRACISALGAGLYAHVHKRSIYLSTWQCLQRTLSSSQLEKMSPFVPRWNRDVQCQLLWCWENNDLHIALSGQATVNRQRAEDATPSSNITKPIIKATTLLSPFPPGPPCQIGWEGKSVFPQFFAVWTGSRGSWQTLKSQNLFTLLKWLRISPKLFFMCEAIYHIRNLKGKCIKVFMHGFI